MLANCAAFVRKLKRTGAAKRLRFRAEAIMEDHAVENPANHTVDLSELLAQRGM